MHLAILLFNFICNEDQQVERLTAFEIVFIIFATAFTLEEYTASKEHGWGSKLFVLSLPGPAVLTDDVIETVYIANVRILQ